MTDASGLTREGFPVGLGVLSFPAELVRDVQVPPGQVCAGGDRWQGKATVALRFYRCWFYTQKAARTGGISVTSTELRWEAAPACAPREVLLCLYHPFSLKSNPQ